MLVSLRLYNRSIFKINLMASFVFALFLSPNLMEDYSIKTIFIATLNGLIISLPTGGFILALFFYQISRKNEYYFFYNMGLSRIQLMIGSYVIHILTLIPLIIIYSYVRSA